MRGPVLMLGPQRPRPNVQDVLATVPGEGPAVIITAGWRHDEADDQALRAAVGPEVTLLPLYTWFEAVMDTTPSLKEAYRARQRQLLELKEVHRMRLHPALDAARRMIADERVDPAIMGPQLAWALEQVRAIDREFMLQARQIRAAHTEIFRPWQDHERVKRMHRRAAEALASARVVVVAGGHVGVLRNRLLFFGLQHVLPRVCDAGAALVCWSAGAMALTERIVLFYDDPPDGPSHPEILDAGLGVVRDLVVLPHSRQRLRLGDEGRVSVLAARFAPAACIGMENGAWLDRVDGELVNRGAPGSALWLRADGSVEPVEGPR